MKLSQVFESALLDCILKLAVIPVACAPFPTQILDLVLSMGLSISEVVTEDNYISDHRPVFFNFDLPASVSKSQSADCYFRPINESTANCFAEAYVKSPVSSIIEASGPSLDTEELTVVFNYVCLDIINDVAPIRLKKA